MKPTAKDVEKLARRMNRIVVGRPLVPFQHSMFANDWRRLARYVLRHFIPAPAPQRARGKKGKR